MHQAPKVKVWPLQPGIVGYNALGEEMALQPGMPGWVEPEDATELVSEGKVQIMVGLTTEDLKKPSYKTRELKSEDPKAEEEDDLGLDDPDESSEEKPTSRRRRGRKGTYQRRDMTAETR